MRTASSIPVPRRSRPFYIRKRFWFSMLLLLLIVGWVPARFTLTALNNLANAPPIGTQYAITDNSVDGFTMHNSRWTRTCAMAQGGTLTLEEHLLWRQNVSFFTALQDLYQTGIFRYTQPSHHKPDDPLRTTAELKVLPWCVNGFRHAVPLDSYDNRIN